MINQINDQPPAVDEIEISLFGPGRGESVIVHLGDNKWMIVDSCRLNPNSKPASIKYLEQIGVKVESSVVAFVISHWHDDHINGAYDIVSKCKNAKIICSGALMTNELADFVGIYKDRFPEQYSGISEFSKISNLLYTKKNKDGNFFSGIDIAIEQIILLRSQLNSGREVIVEALSPTRAAFNLSIKTLAQEILKPKDRTKKRLVKPSPNMFSVALSIRIGDLCILLGSDVEVRYNDKTGWSAIVQNANRPSEKAFCIKVPHHGSKSAYHSCMWTEMVHNTDPIAIIAPYSSGVNPVPTQKDIENIQKHTSRVFCTAKTVGEKSKKFKNKYKDKILKTETRRIINKEMGHIRVRQKISENLAPVVELFHGAHKL